MQNNSELKFTDSHGHIFGLGVKLNEPDLSACLSQEECIELIKRKPAARGNWIIGRGWNQELWVNKAYPDKSSLDAAFPDKPVYLTRVDGHAAWINSKALELCGISRATLNPKGGEIIRDASGEALGILIDNAMNLCLSKIPAYSEAQIEKYILDASEELISKNVFTVHDMDVYMDLIPVFAELAEKNNLPLKVHSFLSAQNGEYIQAGLRPFKVGNLNVCGVKFYADGALGSRGAWLLEPYSDDKENQGLSLISKEELIQKAAKALDVGFIVAAHAIGDAANRMVLDAYGELRMLGYNKASHILRLEHAQIVHPADMQKFKEFKVIPSIQPIHYESDRQMALARLGEERLRYSYPWKSFFKLGLKPVAGSDFPIESHDPQLGIRAFTKPSAINSDLNHEHEKITLEEALKAYTINAESSVV